MYAYDFKWKKKSNFFLWKQIWQRANGFPYIWKQHSFQLIKNKWLDRFWFLWKTAETLYFYTVIHFYLFPKNVFHMLCALIYLKLWNAMFLVLWHFLLLYAVWLMFWLQFFTVFILGFMLETAIFLHLQHKLIIYQTYARFSFLFCSVSSTHHTALF